MKFQSWARLPWKLKDVVRSMRHDLEESRRTTATLLAAVSTLDQRQREMAEELRSERVLALARETERVCEASKVGNALVGEIREQGLLAETAARLGARAEAESALRNKLISPPASGPGVSVLIACWNHAGCLGRAIESSIATLDLLPVEGEVLILDDASRDGSREVARQHVRTDRRVRLIESDANLGLPRARNVLLSQARFDHAMILDSDNQLIPTGVAALYASARQTGAVLNYGNLVEVDPTGSVLGVVSNERVSERLLEENWIDAMVLLQTGRILELGGYDCQWLYGLEDWELNQRLLCLGEPMVFVPVLVGRYTRSALSMIHEAPLDSRWRRSARIFGHANESISENFRAAVFHPEIGNLWASAGWSQGTPTGMIEREAPTNLKVLVVSSGGVLNYGDDAILLSTLERLARTRPGCLVSIISDGASPPPLGMLAAWVGTCEEFCSDLDPDEVRRGCNGDADLAAEICRWISFGPRGPIDLRSYDIVLMAGGGNLNVHWPELLARRAAIAAATNAAGVPYILTGQGIGPVSDAITPMLRFLAAGARAVATRDEHSLRLLQQIVPNSRRMRMVGDDALGLRTDGPIVARNHLAEIGVPRDRPLLGFQAREAPYVGFSREELRETARHVDDIAADHGFVVVAVPINMQSHGPEVKLLAELAYESPRRATWHIVNHAGDVAATAGVFKACNAVLTHSYHAAIFALESRIPTLLFARTEYYQQKGEALRTAFGLPASLVAPPDLTGKRIAEQLETIARVPWGRGMTSADIDTWLDSVLPTSRTADVASIPLLERTDWGLAG